MPEYDTSYQPNITCPYCGWIDRESWEFESDSGTTDCGSCEREFEYYRHVTTRYTTLEPAPARGKEKE